MFITVQQAEQSIGAQYKVIVDNVAKYYARARLLTLFNEVELINMQKELVLKIRKRFSFLNIKPKYDIYANNQGEPYHFKVHSIFPPKYMLMTMADTYEIYGHKGRKYSIFKEKRQIGFIDKTMIAMFQGNFFTAITDDGVDDTIITALILIIGGMSSSDGDNATIKINFGNFTEDRAFDENWNPQLNT